MSNTIAPHPVHRHPNLPDYWVASDGSVISGPHSDDHAQDQVRRSGVAQVRQKRVGRQSVSTGKGAEKLDT